MMGYSELLGRRRAGKVQRAHTKPHIGEYSVAEHTHQMLVLLFGLHPAPSQNLIKAVLYHDLTEYALGDIPSPTKRRFPDLARANEEAERVVRAELDIDVALTKHEQNWLRALDLLELLLWSREQFDMGNLIGYEIGTRVYAYLAQEMTPIHDAPPDWESSIPLPVQAFINSLPARRRPAIL